MSWDAYVETSLMAPLDHEGNTLAGAALVGFDAGIWAQSAAFPALSVEENTTIMSAFEENASVGSYTIGGVKYMNVQGDPGKVVRGKCHGGGCCIYKTASCLVFGIWAEPIVASACNKVVESLGDYLANQGY